MPRRALFMETTKISAERTAGEIQQALSRAGAEAVMIEYDQNREVSAISFRMSISDKPVHFRLPCRWEAIYQIMPHRSKWSEGKPPDQLDKEQARRVAMRQVLRWVESQMAMISTEMVKVQEVFLPYMVNSKGKTFYELMEAGGFAALEYKP